MSLRLLLWTSLIGLAGVACQPAPPKQKPQLVIDHTTLSFDQEFNSATFIGATTYNSALLQNEGLDDLVISNANLQGAGFTMTGPDITTVGFNKSAGITVAFSPTAAQPYTGTITITSNAENSPSATINLTGCGVAVAANPDLSYCKKSTDFK